MLWTRTATTTSYGHTIPNPNQLHAFKNTVMIAIITANLNVFVMITTNLKSLILFHLILLVVNYNNNRQKQLVHNTCTRTLMRPGTGNTECGEPGKCTACDFFDSFRILCWSWCKISKEHRKVVNPANGQLARQRR